MSYIAKALPHMRRAARWAPANAAVSAESLTDAFALLSVPAMLLSRAGAVYHLNDAAEQLRGGDLDVVLGSLVARHPPANTLLAGMVRALVAQGLACEQEPLAPVRVPRRSGSPLLIHGTPLVRSAQDVFQGARAILVIIDPDAGRVRAELHLQLACGLTRAEAATAAALAAGIDFPAVATQRCVGIETIRTQAQSIASKTGVHGRAAQVAFLNRILLRALDDPRLRARRR